MPEVRCLKVIGNLMYAVIGDKVYEINTSMVRTHLGTLTTSTGPAWVETVPYGVGTQVCVIDTVMGYQWTGFWSGVAFPDDFSPSSLTFQDGYFIVSRKDSDRFYISGLNDCAAWNALDYATAEGNADDLVCVYSHNRDLWLLGKTSTEIWFNSGNADFPFQRYEGGFITVGCRSARSVASSDTHVFWLDDDLRVRMGTGIQSEVVSTFQIDYQIKQLSDWGDSIGFVYTMEGHTFYQLTIADKTLVYDVSTGFWHTRASGMDDHRHPAQCHAWFDDKNIIGHYQNGNLYYFDLDAYTNDGEPFRAIRSAQTVHSDRKRVFNAALDVEFEAGVGNAAAPNPRALLQWSDDDGHTFNTGRYADIGASGQYKTRAIWRRLGQARGRVYKVTIDDPVKRVIIGAHLEGETGKS